MSDSLPKPPYWEQPGKKPVLAAFVLTGLVLAVYGFAGNLVSVVVLLVGWLGEYLSTGTIQIGERFDGDYFEMMRRAYEESQALVLGVTVACQFAIFVGLAWLIFRKWHGLGVRDYFRYRNPGPAGLVLPLLGIACLLPVAIFLGELATRAFPFLRRLEELGNVLVMADSRWELALVILAIGLTPALCEEFLFRGYFHRTLSRGMRQPWVYILSGTVFALIHQNYFGLATLILVGIYLGFVYSRFDSIIPGMLVHFCYNSLLVLMSNKPQWFGWLFGDEGFIRWQAVLAGAAGSLLVGWLILRVSRKPAAAEGGAWTAS